MVENSALSVAQTLRELDVNRSSFYEWYGRYRANGYDGLASRKPTVRRFWNPIPVHEKELVVAIALEHPEQSPRQLACFITDRCGYFLSESSVYRILKAYDLVPSPAYIVMAAADSFPHPTGRVHELWQTEFTYLKSLASVGWQFATGRDFCQTMDRATCRGSFESTSNDEGCSKPMGLPTTR